MGISLDHTSHIVEELQIILFPENYEDLVHVDEGLSSSQQLQKAQVQGLASVLSRRITVLSKLKKKRRKEKEKKEKVWTTCRS